MILSLLDYFQRVLWDKRHKELWKYAYFSPIPPGTPIIPQGMYILMIGAVSNYYDFSFFFFQVTEHMLAYSLRKADIEILFIFYFKAY